ncbi:MAG: alpha-N-arabinofuranosidase [Lachnospiraceae bacterium]|nr:alpha-N-arabinofuranosidase [Lachnospiraceae bacterium]
MKLTIDPERVLFSRDPMIYGHFLEHFDRQVYGGVYDPGNPLSDEDGFRTDVIEALKAINTPVIRWPGGCFVSAYHWKNGVGKDRVPSFDKAWRVEEPNSFGTDEFVKLCRKIGCEPYICTNAGTGTSEEMSDWVEYCNLPTEGEYAKKRIDGGNEAPYNVRYWSVGNENYLPGEMGSKTFDEWGRFVLESAKMMHRVDPSIELSAAAHADVDWCARLLKEAGKQLRWISLHDYMDPLWEVNAPAGYTACMARTTNLDDHVKKIRGLLTAFGLEKQIRIAYDEWNLRSWHHPHVNDAPIGSTEFLDARKEADDNSVYTTADSVFTGCFLNMCLKNADIVGMANYAPVVNTRGVIYTYDGGIVLRPTYHVFRMYTQLMGDTIVDGYEAEAPVKVMKDRTGKEIPVQLIDSAATIDSASGELCISLINKDPEEAQEITLRFPETYAVRYAETLAGTNADDYNDVDRNDVVPYENTAAEGLSGQEITFTLPAHSVSVVRLNK